MSTYIDVHRAVGRLHGPASDHTCPCGRPAEQWAYQFTGDPELRYPDGTHPHSTNPDDYVAMCRSCHKKFDIEHDSVFAETTRTTLASTHSRMKSDREFGDRLRSGRRANALKRRQCLECDLTSSASGIGIHQKNSRHVGWVNLNEEPAE